MYLSINGPEQEPRADAVAVIEFRRGSASTGSNQLARQEMRNRIMGAASRVFSTEGYKAATVEDIIREAGVARGSFYHYFSSKRQVFFELLKEFLDNLYENTRTGLLRNDIDADAFTERIREGLVFFYRYFLENKGLVEVYYREAFGTDPTLYAVWDDFDRKMIHLISSTLDTGAASGLLREMDTGLVARAMLMISLQVPYNELMVHGRTDLDLESVADEMVRFAMRGILSDEALAVVFHEKEH